MPDKTLIDPTKTTVSLATLATVVVTFWWVHGLLSDIENAVDRNRDAVNRNNDGIERVHIELAKQNGSSLQNARAIVQIEHRVRILEGKVKDK